MQKNKIIATNCITIAMLFAAFSGHAQNASPWKKLNSKVVDSVLLSMGRHTYSLSGGQGFSVYIKNNKRDTVLVTGKLVAKTVCGNEVSTSFNALIPPFRESKAANFTCCKNGQTGVVTKYDCLGKWYYIRRKKVFIKRISSVYVKDVVVQNHSAVQQKGYNKSVARN